MSIREELYDEVSAGLREAHDLRADCARRCARVVSKRLREALTKALVKSDDVTTLWQRVSALADELDPEEGQ